jgi:ribosomal protein L10
MSRAVKELVTRELAARLDGVQDALLVNVVGLDANQSVVLRRRLREKEIHLLVVKNSLARRATEGTPLAPALVGSEGEVAIVWGAEDMIALAKEITELNDDSQFEAFQTRGGVMDGERLSTERVREISKWPTREEQLSIVLGQVLSPGAALSSQLLGPGRRLASQLEKKPPADT